VALGVFRFLTLIQVFEGPDLYGASSFLETIPSRPSLQKDERIASHVFTLEHQQVKGRGDGNVIVKTAVEQIKLRPAFGIEIYRLSINND